MVSGRVDKRAVELALSAAVAKIINETEGTDYRPEVVEAEDSIEDVILRSATGTYRDRGVQVVTIPVGDVTVRSDSDHRQRLMRELQTRLAGADLGPSWINVVLSDAGTRYGVNHAMIERLVQLIVQMARTGKAEIRETELFQYDPELAERLVAVAVTPVPQLSGIRVGIPMATYVPRDGRWIRDGIDKKLKDYGGPLHLKELTLIIGDFGVVDREQIDAFRRDNPPDTLPFDEIWLVSRIEGVDLLKRRR